MERISSNSLYMRLVVVALSLALIFSGQAVFDVTQSDSSSADTFGTLGDTGFAYLTGLRTYAAAVLWNRIEPILHGYFAGVPLEEQRYIVPTISAVVMLDPQFVDAYYVGAWVVAANGHEEEGLALAKSGVEANPLSGRTRENYAQLLHLFGNDLGAAHDQAVIAMGDEMRWRDDFEKHDAYAVLGSIMRASGDEVRAARVDDEIERLDTVLGDSLPPGSHDHDGDGVPDH